MYYESVIKIVMKALLVLLKCYESIMKVLLLWVLLKCYESVMKVLLILWKCYRNCYESVISVIKVLLGTKCVYDFYDRTLQICCYQKLYVENIKRL